MFPCAEKEKLRAHFGGWMFSCAEKEGVWGRPRLPQNKKTMFFQVLTHFPERYHSYLERGLPAKALQKGLFQVRALQIRDFADEARKGRVDDAPYGGGPGMILQVAPIDRALRSLEKTLPVILFTPRGQRLKQRDIHRFAKEGRGYTLICGYFEGVDERVAEHLADHQISLGDFVLGSGDLAALCFIEALTRLLPGYMGCKQSLVEESMEKDLLEYPQYTRPREYRGWKVPELLLSGKHESIALWRKEQSEKLSQKRKHDENV